MLVLMLVMIRQNLGSVIDQWRAEVEPALAQIEAQAMVARLVPDEPFPHVNATEEFRARFRN